MFLTIVGKIWSGISSVWTKIRWGGHFQKMSEALEKQNNLALEACNRAKAEAEARKRGAWFEVERLLTTEAKYYAGIEGGIIINDRNHAVRKDAEIRTALGALPLDDTSSIRGGLDNIDPKQCKVNTSERAQAFRNLAAEARKKTSP